MILGVLGLQNSNRLIYKNITFAKVTIPGNGYLPWSQLDEFKDIKNVAFVSLRGYGIRDPQTAYFVPSVGYIIGTPGAYITNLAVTFWMPNKN